MSKKVLYGMLSGVFAVGMLAACGDIEEGEDPAGVPDENGEELDDDGGDL